MASPKEIRSWRSGGRKKSRKKSAQPQVIGLFLTLAALSGALIWAIWPKPMTQVHLFVIAGEDNAPSQDADARFIRDLPARFDALQVGSVFTELADQVQSITSARRMTPSEFKGLSIDEMDCRGDSAIVFLHAFSRVSATDDRPAELKLQFGTDRNVISFADLATKLAESGLRESVVLLEISHERPAFGSATLVNEGVALLEAELASIQETFPDLHLTVISSTSPLKFSYPHIVNAGEIQELNELPPEQEIVQGTVFGKAVADTFRSGDFWTIDELTETLREQVENEVSQNFGGEQSPYRLATYTTKEPVGLFHEHHQLANNPAETEPPPAEQNAPEQPDDSKTEKVEKKSPTEEYDTYRNRVAALTDGPVARALTIGDWKLLGQFASDLKYTLHHGDLKNFQALLDQGQRLILQIESAGNTTSQAEKLKELVTWISPPPAEVDASFFSNLAADVNQGEAVHSTKLVETLANNDARIKLVSSFLLQCDSALTEISNDSPEAQAQRAELRKSWGEFFVRLPKVAGWRQTEWPNQFLVADDLLRNSPELWTDRQFAAFTRILLLRNRALLAVGGWAGNPLTRLDQSVYDSLQQELSLLLDKVTAAERWFLVGPPALGILEKQLADAEQSLAGINRQLTAEQEKRDLLKQHRLHVLSQVEQLALLQDSIILSEDQIAPLSQLSPSNLAQFSATDFPQASFSPLVSRDDAIALLHLTTHLTPKSIKQEVIETESAMNRFRHLTDPLSLKSVSEEYRSSPDHQGIWLSFWSIRTLHALDDTINTIPLFEAWRNYLAAVAGKSDVLEKAATRDQLSRLLKNSWQSLSNIRLIKSQEVSPEQTAPLVEQDLLSHLRLSGNRYASMYRKLFEPPNSRLNKVKLSEESNELRLQDGVCTLDLDIPDQQQVYFHPQGVRLLNPRFREIDGWQVGPWDQSQNKLKASETFAGSAEPLIVILDDKGIVEDFRQLRIGVVFQVSGWNVRFSSKEIQLREVDLSDSEKILWLPPVSGAEPLPLSVELLQPENSFTESVLVNIAPLNALGEPGPAFWPAYQKVSLNSETRSAPIPLFPAPAEGSEPTAPPADGFDLTNGFAFLIRPQENAANQDVVIKVSLNYFNPLDKYVSVSEPEYNTDNHQLLVPIRRRSDIAANGFPPKKIGAEMSFSRDLASHSVNPPPKRPEITESQENLQAIFRPDLNDAIRKSESEVGRDRLEFGLSVGGLENVARWRLGQSLEMERIGYARSGSTNEFGNSSEIRIGLNVTNKEDEGVFRTNLDGLLTLGQNWQKAVLDLPLELHGFQAETARASRLELALLKEEQQGSTSQPLTLASLPIKDAYQRSVIAKPEGAQWLMAISSRPHGKFGVNLFESFRLTEGRHRLEATLKDEDTSRPIAVYQTDFIIDDSAPSVVWRDENPEEVLINKNYTGYLTVEDPQSGLEAISVGVNPEGMTSIPLKSSHGEKKPLKIPFVIKTSDYPEIAPQNVAIRKRLKVLIEATNRIGMVRKFSQNIEVVRPAASMDDGKPKTGTLVVKLSGTSAYDVFLTGAGGKEKRELTDTKQTASFDDLPEGSYTLSWTKKYDNSKGSKSIVLKFKKTGDVFNSSL